MASVDTSVLVRSLTEDEDEQTRQAEAFLRSAGRVFISHVVLVEATSVLVTVYGLSRDEIRRALDLLLNDESLAVERPELAAEALRLFRESSADFADCLILAVSRAANELPLATFDDAAGRLPGARRLGSKRKR